MNRAIVEDDRRSFPVWYRISDPRTMSGEVVQDTLVAVVTGDSCPSEAVVKAVGAAVTAMVQERGLMPGSDAWRAIEGTARSVCIARGVAVRNPEVLH